MFCKKDHSAHNCDVVTDYQKRTDIVKEGRLCYNCLAHHRVSQCTSKFRCRKCKKKHHTSLCSSDSPTQGTTPEKKNASDDTPTTTTGGFLTPASCSAAPQNPTCLLKTAVAPIVAGNTRSQANILFDEGAQRSFISAEMASEPLPHPEQIYQWHHLALHLRPFRSSELPQWKWKQNLVS